MQKYVIDTNIFVEQPEFILDFEESEIIIPLSVVQELDGLKKRDGETGQRVRDAIRVLEKVLVSDQSEYGTNIIKVLEDNTSIEKVDDRVIDLALQINSSSSLSPKILTNDLAIKIKARSKGIECESYYGNMDNNENFRGNREKYIDKIRMDELYNQNFTEDKIKEIHLNEYVNFLTYDGCSALTRYIGNNIYVLLGQNLNAWGIKAKNKEQIYALDALLDEDIPLVCLRGKAGSGKTILTLASALEKTKEHNRYEQIIITRSLEPVSGKTLGFLPGDMNEKMKPWMAGITDNLKQLLGSKENIDFLIEQGEIQLFSLEYMRGRSLQNTYIIVEEAQNLTKEDAKVLLTRVGKGSKIVFIGDIDQRDNRRVSKESNGLSYIIKRFHLKDEYHKLFAHVDLVSGKLRSEIADIAGEIL